MQRVAPVPDGDGVTGVGPALKAGDDVEVLGQHVDDLALALVTPLGTDDGDIRHGSSYGCVLAESVRDLGGEPLDGEPLGAEATANRRTS